MKPDDTFKSALGLQTYRVLHIFDGLCLTEVTGHSGQTITALFRVDDLEWVRRGK